MLILQKFFTSNYFTIVFPFREVKIAIFFDFFHKKEGCNPLLIGVY